jgi:hypothetical protein
MSEAEPNPSKQTQTRLASSHVPWLLQLFMWAQALPEASCDQEPSSRPHRPHESTFVMDFIVPARLRVLSGPRSAGCALQR